MNKEEIDYIKRLKNQSFEGWNKEQIDAYLTALISVEEYAQQQLATSWVKASERLPEKDGWYFIKHFGRKYSSLFQDGEFEIPSYEEKDIEWLDEQPAERAAQTDEEPDIYDAVRQYREDHPQKDVATDEYLDGELRMIIGHALLGEDQNISRDGFDLVISEIIKFIKNGRHK